MGGATSSSPDARSAPDPATGTSPLHQTEACFGGLDPWRVEPKGAAK